MKKLILSLAVLAVMVALFVAISTPALRADYDSNTLNTTGARADANLSIHYIKIMETPK